MAVVELTRWDSSSPIDLAIIWGSRSLEDERATVY